MTKSTGMRPFIRAADKRDFEQCLARNGISDNAASSLPSWSPASDATGIRFGIVLPRSERVKYMFYSSTLRPTVEVNNQLFLTMTPPTPLARTTLVNDEDFDAETHV